MSKTPSGQIFCDECDLPILRGDDYITIGEGEGGPWHYHQECYDLRDGVPVEDTKL